MTNEQVIAYLDRLPADKLVLHASNEKHDILKPAYPEQAHLIPEYNQCAVYGTLFTEIALAYAVIHESRADWGWEFDPDKKPHIFIEGPKYLRAGIGYVHILKRSDFTQVIEPGLVCLAFEEVVPRRVIEVQPNILEVLQSRRRIRFL